jgi:hypothetical protein
LPSVSAGHHIRPASGRAREAIVKTKGAVPGKNNASELFKRVLSDDPQMRLPSKGERLTAKEIAFLKAWSTWHREPNCIR